jgi:hypothetical protein
MALAASYLACRLIVWTREIITFVAPAHPARRAYHPTRESNAGRGRGVPEQKAQLMELPGKIALTIRSITFERPSTGLSNPYAADSLPAGLNLTLCCCKSGADEAH